MKTVVGCVELHAVAITRLISNIFFMRAADFIALA